MVVIVEKIVKRVYHACEICGQESKELDAAKRCEAKGRTEPYPLGLIYQYATPPPTYVGVLDSRPHNHGLDVQGLMVKHLGSTFGYMISAQERGIPQSGKLRDKNAVNVGHEAFLKTVEVMRERGVTELSVWDGEKIVPYE